MATGWIAIDGSEGEGGGQMLRTALALSLVTGRPFRIDRIRARRRKPGLLRQHLTAVAAAAAIGAARVTGDDLGSMQLSFEPTGLRGGDYRFIVGTAGSATLVLQAVLPALIAARDPSRLTLEGGTHNPGAPPFEFLAQTFLPILRRMGVAIDIALEAHGFYPAGGGRLLVSIAPCANLARLSLVERGPAAVHARALVASLPESIGRRELGIVRDRLGLEREACQVQVVHDSAGPGNVLLIVVKTSAVTEVIAGFGARGVPAEKVAGDACDEAQAYLAADVPVGVNLADQLLVPMALAGGGTFRTLEPTLHAVTNAGVIRRFMDVPIDIAREQGHVHRVRIGPAGTEAVEPGERLRSD
jgi:RNA 3'-terminal phosphate cyclase (ATP)